MASSSSSPIDDVFVDAMMDPSDQSSHASQSKEVHPTPQQPSVVPTQATGAVDVSRHLPDRALPVDTYADTTSTHAISHPNPSENTPLTANTTGRGVSGNHVAGVNLQETFTQCAYALARDCSVRPPNLPPFNHASVWQSNTTGNAPLEGGNERIPFAFWICHDVACGKKWPNKRKRCACGKWKGGKRDTMAPRKPKSKEARTRNAPAHTPPPARSAPASNNGPRRNPVGEVAVTPQGACPSDLSPMTGCAEEGDDSSANTSSTASTSSLIEGSDDIDLLTNLYIKQTGDGGTSDGEGEGFEMMNDLQEAARIVTRDGQVNDREGIEDDVCDDEQNCTVSEIVPGAPPSLDGAPVGWIKPGPWEKWSYSHKLEKGEPHFNSVDNPANWSSATFKGVVGTGQTGKYSHHEMPAGATPVPKNQQTGKRENGGYEFFYSGWELPEEDRDNPKFTRSGATRDNLFPPDRDCKLDVPLLKKLGLTKKRMAEGDAFFFYQLLVPIVSEGESGIEGDPRIGYYESVADATNTYAMAYKKRGGTRGHFFRPTNAEEMLNWDGIVARNLNENIGNCWRLANGKSNSYDSVIAGTMKFRRWFDIKGVYKQNPFYEEKKRGDEGYDPCQKYRKIWDVMTHNMNQLILEAGKDAALDESTWPNASYADCQGRLQGKKTDKGGQHVMVIDCQRRYLYSWTPRHKFHTRTPPFTQEGPAEVKRLVDSMAPLLQGAPKADNDKRRQIFTEPLHLGMDNHFSHDEVVKYLGENGHKATLTCQRGRLPRLCEKKYFHHKKGVAIDWRSKMARFEEPITAVKKVTQPPGSGKEDYYLVHVSFQSTGGTNISTVNSLKECKLYVRQRERGRGKGKRVWAIEMNEGRETYLKTYSAVDKIDQMLKSYALDYISWRWWHAPMRHGKAIAMSMAHQIYKHCAEGRLEPEWKVDQPMNGPEWRTKLSLQMCEYQASELEYPGDLSLRNATQTKKRDRGKRKRRGDALERCSDDVFRVSYGQYVDAKKPRRQKTRLCSDDLDLLKEHLRSFTHGTKGVCQICGKADQEWRCGICNKTVCYKDARGKSNMVSCSMDYHNDDYFGLALGDRLELFGEQKTKFKGAKKVEIKRNKEHMKAIRRKYAKEMEKHS